MNLCPRCAKPAHGDGACAPGSLAPPPGASIPPPGSSIPPMGVSGAYAAAQNPTSRALRMLKTQLNLAVGQREEDPERAWLELVSVRERLGNVASDARSDPLLTADVERFRAKLEEQIEKLTRDVGDELIAPLYAWLDLLRQRGQLDSQVESAHMNVAQARASRGASPPPPFATDGEVDQALERSEKELAWWRAEVPSPPPPMAFAVWAESGGDALRPTLAVDPQIVRTRGLAARAIVDRTRGRPLGAVPYVGSKLELTLVPTIGTCALLASVFTLASTAGRTTFGAVAVLGWLTFAAALGFSIFARQRASTERAAAIDAVWHHTLYAEQAASLDLEIGWLRMLAAAMRARRAFDERRGEGGQLVELASWRPDLEPIVVEVARWRASSPPG